MAISQCYCPNKMRSKHEEKDQLQSSPSPQPLHTMILLELSAAGNRLAVSLTSAALFFCPVPFPSPWSQPATSAKAICEVSAHQDGQLQRTTPRLPWLGWQHPKSARQQRMGDWPNSKDREIKAQGNIKVFVNWTHATATLNIREKNKKKKNSAMHELGR